MLRCHPHLSCILCLVGGLKSLIWQGNINCLALSVFSFMDSKLLTLVQPQTIKTLFTYCCFVRSSSCKLDKAELAAHHWPPQIPTPHPSKYMSGPNTILFSFCHCVIFLACDSSTWMGRSLIEVKGVVHICCYVFLNTLSWQKRYAPTSSTVFPVLYVRTDG